MKTNIALIGFMGTGKTAVGKLLAEKTGREFLELDAMIEEKAGMTIPEIFRQEGETGFREREIAAVTELSGRKNSVIACGGGVVLNTINIDRLREECLIVCLTASTETVIKRTGEDGGARPLLDTVERAARVAELLKFRKPLYRQAADFTVATSRLSLENVAAAIISKLKVL
ncbi:MAG: shikimate kinase [Dehalococcoidales bacterium]|nr:shikimate kinase [Dehalococcoidales bacterium]